MLNKEDIGLVIVYDGRENAPEIHMTGADPFRRNVMENVFPWNMHNGNMWIDIPLKNYISTDNDFKIYDKIADKKADFTLINKDGKSHIKILSKDPASCNNVSQYDLVIEWEEPVIESKHETSVLQYETIGGLNFTSLQLITQKLTRTEYVYLHNDLWKASEMLAAFPLIRDIITADNPITVIPFKLKNGLLELDLLSGELEVININTEQVEVRLLTRSALVKLTTSL